MSASAAKTGHAVFQGAGYGLDDSGTFIYSEANEDIGIKMKKRATIVISGDVQDVGFRGIVMRIAQKSGLAGYVENVPDGTVRVICEGEEKATQGFIKKLNVRNGDTNVEKVDVKWSKAQGRFVYFQIKYSDLGAEMFQGFATAGRKLSAIDHNLGCKIDGMHIDMNTRFDTLDTKYGEISNKMNDLTTELQKSTNALVAMTEKVGALIDKKLAE